MNSTIRTLVLSAMAMWISSASLRAQTFSSGSTGADGALSFVTPGTYNFDPRALSLDRDGDGVFHFTTITVASGVTIRLSAKYLSGPVIWLASSAIVIDGTLDLNGDDGHPAVLASQSRPAIPGAGGYCGGIGGNNVTSATAGCGPGGGAGATAFGLASAGSNGGLSNNRFLLPLFGGSGGGGAYLNGTSSYGCGGGAGGGALLLASSVSITINGLITASGGIGNSRTGVVCATGSGNFQGGNGSGGAVRIVSNAVTGSGAIRFNTTSGASTGGAVRIESYSSTIPISVSLPLGSGYYQSTPFGLFLPTTVAPLLRVVSVNGIALPPTPDGSFAPPDVTISQAGPVPVVIAAKSVPPGTTVQLRLIAEDAPDVTLVSPPLAGSPDESTTTVMVTFPAGFSRGVVRATWTAP